MASLVSLQLCTFVPQKRFDARNGVLFPIRASFATRSRKNALQQLFPKAVEQEASDMVLIPWNAEESWSEESEKLMSRLITRFKAADKDGNGVIDRDEMRDLLERVGDGDEAVPMHWLTEEDVEAVYKQYDTNKDGVISFEEFVRMAQDKVFLEGQLEQYQLAFKAVDVGGNGTVGATELYGLFESMGQPISYDKLVKVFEKYDHDGSGVIDFSEFLRMFKDELLDLQQVLGYIKMGVAPPPGKEQEAAEQAPESVAEAPALAPGGVSVVFSEDEFRSLLASNPTKMVVLMASLTWCKPCKKFMSSYQELAGHYGQSVVFLKMYGNSNDSTKHLFKEQLKCRSTPTFFFFRGTQLVGQCKGANGPRLEYNLRTMLKSREGPEGNCFPPYTPEEE